MEYIKAKKSFGQNFLKNNNVLDKIASSIKTTEKDLIIEIGPGMGALTKKLKEKKSFLIGYEIDNRMEEYLKNFIDDKTKIIYDDFLKRNVESDLKKINYENVYVIANIPYYITSPIILNLINSSINYKEITLLVQKEVAERIVKDNNALSLGISYLYNSEILFLVNRNNFVPAPKVDSAVIKLVRKNNIDIKNKDLYFKFVRDAFSTRRKTLKNNLKNYDWNLLKNILFNLGYDENVRAEAINRNDFLILFKSYYNI